MQTNENENLWGIKIEPTKTETPKQIIDQQARWLEKITNGALYGLVETEKFSENMLTHSFIIYSPSLDYRYVLFKLSHSVLMYPLKVRSAVFKDDRVRQCKNQEQFKAVVADILSDNLTKRIVNSLLAQAD